MWVTGLFYFLSYKNPIYLDEISRTNQLLEIEITFWRLPFRPCYYETSRVDMYRSRDQKAGRYGKCFDLTFLSHTSNDNGQIFHIS